MNLTRVTKALAGTLAGVLALALPPGPALADPKPPHPAPALPAGSEDGYAREYHRLLLEHTRWVETVWDRNAGYYELKDFNFTVVFGNAVLLRFGEYDQELAGVSAGTLRQHTLATIRHFAASNRWAGGSEWGAQIYWDSTLETYFVGAARLLWDDLDEQTRANVDAIVRGEANYVLGPGRDEATNGLDGAYRGNSRIEEMGAKSMPLATAVAYLPDDPSAPAWHEWMNRWTLSMGGLPPADQANPTPIEGKPVAQWTQAHNIYDSFIVENHESYAPIYQESMGAYPGRNAVHFLIAGKRPPESLTELPNGDELWATLAGLGTDAGLSAHPMVADRYHLYGRDVLPLAYRTTMLGDRYAARAEQMLLGHLGPYVQYPPENRLTKFSGEPKYEPEARAELAMSYLLHYWRGQLAGDARPVSADELFAKYSGATDYGAEIGLVGHQTGKAVSAAVSKPGFVKFAWLPQHDDWLFNYAGSAPSLIPSTAMTVQGRSAHVYRRATDGYDASATLFSLAGGYAGFTTLPNGQSVYATSGTAANEGRLGLFNLAMPGIDGLDGDRTFTAASGTVTLAGGVADGGTDEVRFPATDARYLRMAGERPGSGYGYSMWEFEAYGPSDGENLALGRPASASTSYDQSTYVPARAVDGDPATRWANAIAERPSGRSSFTVDLGSARTVDRVKILWETAYASAYRIQGSLDGKTWQDLSVLPPSRDFTGNWINVDGRAGFVIRDSDNPIAVDPSNVTLSAGPASGSAGMIVEARPAETPAQTARAAAAPALSGGPAALRASRAGGYLSLFNLGSVPVTDAELTLPQPGGSLALYRGVQRTAPGGTTYDVTLGAADARVEAPRFVLSARHPNTGLPPLRVEVRDSCTVTVENLSDGRSGRVAQLDLATADDSQRRPVTVPAGRTTTVDFRCATPTPVSDLARTRTTFPTSPLPAGMTDPDRAVDGNPDTTWRPGPAGRMVVDLGAGHDVDAVTLRWSPGRVAGYTVATSDDGLTFSPASTAAASGPREQRITLDRTARYLAIQVDGWAPGGAELAELAVGGAPAASPLG